MIAEVEPIRYDLVTDVADALIQKGLLTSDQRKEAEREWIRACGASYVSLAETLVRGGWASREKLKEAWSSLTFFFPPSEDDPFQVPEQQKIFSLVMSNPIEFTSPAVRLGLSADACRVSYVVDGEWFDMETLSRRLRDYFLGALAGFALRGRMRVRRGEVNADLRFPDFSSEEERELLIRIEYS